MGHWYLESCTGSRSFHPACWHKLYHTPTRRSINSTYYVLLPSTPLAIDFAVTKPCAYVPRTRPRCFRCSFKESEQLTRQISLPLPIASIPPLPTNPPLSIPTSKQTTKSTPPPTQPTQTPAQPPLHPHPHIPQTTNPPKAATEQDNGS